MTHRLLLSTAAVISLCAGGAYAQSSATASDSIRPFSGDIDPFSGDIDPFSGDINPFSGDISPFRGDIDPFYGDISPFWGDISPFYGDIDPFAGDINPFTGDIAPFWGDIDPFANGQAVSGLGDYWQSVGPQWGDINEAWGNLGSYSVSTQSGYISLRNDLNSIFSAAGALVDGVVQSRINTNFENGVLDPLLARYGIDLDDASSLENIDAATRSRFFLEFYDSVQSFSGYDQVDHWVGQINWSPSITQDQGSGHDAIVGLLDVRIAANDDNIEFLTNVGGYTISPNEHGAAVASLIAARHDGRGVLGIAPRANVLAYSPFDQTGTASFADIQAGVETLTSSGANVINMSLGVPGYVFNQSVADIFRSSMIQSFSDNTTFVIAAGNEGVTQTTDVTFGSGNDFDNLLFVGSVGPTGRISSFSNRPGEACLLQQGACSEDAKLKNRFLVAPGELILVSDNNGGTTRLSGTSFAAPLVTGAVSLLHDRWPWLQQHAEETTDIILQTATDLGDAGVDGVYGHGLLNVEASQAPLSFDNLSFYKPLQDANGNTAGFYSTTAQSVRDSILNPSTLNVNQLAGARLVAVEVIGDTHRDFNIPLSTLLYGQESTTINGGQERVQRHVYDRLVDWAGGGGGSLFQQNETQIDGGEGWSLTAIATPVSQFAPDQYRDRPYAPGIRLQSGGATFEIGEGRGALALTSGDGFDRHADHDPETGGVNPFLGFATGGAYASLGAQVAPGVKLGFGFSEVRDDLTFVDADTGERLRDDPLIGLADYEASAVTANVAIAVASNVRLNASYTRLSEETGVLGAQGSGALALENGAATNALTIGASTDLHPKLTLAASATVGRTEGSDGLTSSNSILSIGEEGLTSTAFEVAATTRDLFRRNDRFRVSAAQPLYVENGDLRVSTVQIVDRTTGELGAVDDFIDLGGGRRRFVAEAEYAMPMWGDRAEASFYTRFDTGDVSQIDGSDAVAGGARFTLRF